MDIVKENFASMSDQIITDIENCDFLAIDLEMTGISTRGDLMDSISARYEDMRKAVFTFSIIQCGICLFKRLESGQYEAVPYNFYVFPDDQGRRVSINLQTLNFLKSVKIDFNKWVNEGIPYQNTKYAGFAYQKLFAQNNDDEMISKIKESDQVVLDEILDTIRTWLDSSPEENSFDLPQVNSYLKRCIFALVPKHFPHLVVDNETDETGKQIGFKVYNFTEQQRKEHEGAQMAKFYAKIGFKRIFDKIVECQKPLIGHNLWYDLLFIMQAFSEELPKTLGQFKTDVNKLFPLIYDTKIIQYTLRQVEEGIWSGPYQNHLEGLYNFVNEKSGSIKIAIRPGMDKYSESGHAHEAAWDAYMTGVCFLRMHTYGDVTPCANKLNMFGGIWFVNLLGPDQMAPGEHFFISHGHVSIDPFIQESATVRIRHIDSASFLLICKDRDETEQILTLLEGDNFKVRPYVAKKPSPIKGKK